MEFYLDDDSVDPMLIRLLRAAAHGTRIPAEIGQSGSPDVVHLRNAIREGRILLTGNYEDFALLHELIMEARG